MLCTPCTVTTCQGAVKDWNIPSSSQPFGDEVLVCHCRTSTCTHIHTHTYTHNYVALRLAPWHRADGDAGGAVAVAGGGPGAARPPRGRGRPPRRLHPRLPQRRVCVRAADGGAGGAWLSDGSKRQCQCPRKSAATKLYQTKYHHFVILWCHLFGRVGRKVLFFFLKDRPLRTTSGPSGLRQKLKGSKTHFLTFCTDDGMAQRCQEYIFTWN